MTYPFRERKLEQDVINFLLFCDDAILSALVQEEESGMDGLFYDF